MLVNGNSVLSCLKLHTPLTFPVGMLVRWCMLKACTFMDRVSRVKRDLTLLMLTTSVTLFLGSNIGFLLRYRRLCRPEVHWPRPPTNVYTAVNTRLDMSRLHVLSVPAITAL